MHSPHSTVNDRELVLPAELEDAIDAAVLRLINNVGQFVDEATLKIHTDTWERAAARQSHWLTPELVDDALTVFLDRKTEKPEDRKLPPVGDFIDVCRAIKTSAESKRALPAPPREPASPEPAAYARNTAIGKARQRKRIGLLNAYRATLPAGTWLYGGEQSHHWRGKDTPTEAEIDAVLREMHKTGQINAETLEAALALRVEINVLTVAWESSPITVGTPGEAAPVGPNQPTGPRVTVRWNDGKESSVTLMDAQHARAAERWLRTHSEADPQPA